jgi:NAD+ kinase
VKRAALVLHADRSEAVEIGRWLAHTLADAGVEVVALPSDAARLGEPVSEHALDEIDQGIDLMFALGGDGTFLHAAALAAPSGTPLLGVNLGRLGFLAALERGELQVALGRILADGFETTDRMAIEAKIAGGGVAQRVWALNDVSVSKVNPGRTIKLAVSIAGERFTIFAADGLIVATPTGSTAYSFSARGPVVSPALDCLILTPVSPHQTFDRTIVTGPDETIEITVLSDSDAAAVSADGRGAIELPPGSTIEVMRSEQRLRLVNVDAGPFWRLVREKFRLGTDR